MSPLRVMRRVAEGTRHFSSESALFQRKTGGHLWQILGEENGARRAVPGSISFVPPAAGLLIAGEVIRELAGIC